MSISVVQNVLDDMHIEYTKINGMLRIYGTTYSYVISYDEDESAYNLVSYDEDETRIGALDFTMKIFPTHFKYTKLYFEKWFKGVNEVITHYYMEKS